MRRFPARGIGLLASAALLVGCDDDRAPIVEPVVEPVVVTVDDRLRAALAEAGVVPVDAPAPEDPALVHLGKMLFFDKILSGNENISCGTCHHPTAFTADALPLSIGEGGVGTGASRRAERAGLMPRNAPGLFNDGVSVAVRMFWDSRIRVEPDGSIRTPEPGLDGSDPRLAPVAPLLEGPLEAVAMFPVTNPEEMLGLPGSNPVADLETRPEIWDALVHRLVGSVDEPGSGIGEYRTLFRAAFPGVWVPTQINFGHVARAIAAFERETWVALGTPLDAYLQGNDDALGEAEKRGALLFFGRAGCGACHNGPLLTDQRHHARAVPQLGPGHNEPNEDRGLGFETGDPRDDYRFRTPPLRNVALTGPWMHDGAYADLRSVVRHELDPAAGFTAYDGSELPPFFRALLDTDPGRNEARLAALDPAFPPVDLTEAEIDDVLAFLHALTDPASLAVLGALPDRVPSGLPVHDDGGG